MGSDQRSKANAAFHSTVTPYLCVSNAAKAIEFYRAAFGAKEITRIPMADGKLGHAEIEIGGARIMLSDEFQEMQVLSPQTLGGSPVMLHLLVADVDAVAEQAVAAGATVEKPVQDQFHGHRSGQLTDPFGHRWDIATQLEALSPAEIEKRARELFGSYES